MLEMLIEADERLRRQAVELWLAALNPEAMELVQHTPLAERIGRARMHFTVEQGVAAFEARSEVQSNAHDRP